MLRILKAAGLVLTALVLLLVARFVYLNMTATPPDHAQAGQSALAPCPDSPNCVSSQAERESQRIEPLLVEGDAAEAMAKLESAVERMTRARVVTSADGYLHAEFTSALFRFVDDLEAIYDPDLPGFHVRSASRVGHSDLGANRKRVEALRGMLR